MKDRIKKIFPEDLFLSVLPDFVLDEETCRCGCIDARRLRLLFRLRPMVPKIDGLPAGRVAQRD